MNKTHKISIADVQRKISSLKKEHKLTQNEIAERLGYRPNTLSNYIATGRGLDTLWRKLDTFDIRLNNEGLNFKTPVSQKYTDLLHEQVDLLKEQNEFFRDRISNYKIVMEILIDLLATSRVTLRQIASVQARQQKRNVEDILSELSNSVYDEAEEVLKAYKHLT